MVSPKSSLVLNVYPYPILLLPGCVTSPKGEETAPPVLHEEREMSPKGSFLSTSPLGRCEDERSEDEESVRRTDVILSS